MGLFGISCVVFCFVVSIYLTRKMLRSYESIFRADIVEMVKNDPGLQEEIKKWL